MLCWGMRIASSRKTSNHNGNSTVLSGSHSRRFHVRTGWMCLETTIILCLQPTLSTNSLHKEMLKMAFSLSLNRTITECACWVLTHRIYPVRPWNRIHSVDMPYWLNLYGFLSAKTRLQILQSTSENKCSFSIAFGHIPLALLNTRSILRFFRQSGVFFYLSGHLHDSHGQFYVPSFCRPYT